MNLHFISLNKFDNAGMNTDYYAFMKHQEQARITLLSV
ncbi:hypothetical protein PAUR_a1755 [Pseudoalteromonas aurantia 208]|uniref:Uncharacterized protein n=1 Tax=Pseudoalteromonas aurantia 208 TaxID=1314867 RepID=A0ABR9EB62_9GAMM|nr:hypothetical protein [Pseudoalteromonas aurantia 208]